MKKPGKPKYKKAPKTPKTTANKTTWDRYEQKLKDIEKYNNKLTVNYKKEIKKYETEVKRRDKIKEQARGGLGKI